MGKTQTAGLPRRMPQPERSSQRRVLQDYGRKKKALGELGSLPRGSLEQASSGAGTAPLSMPRLAALRPTAFDGVDRELRAISQAQLPQDLGDVVAGGPFANVQGACYLGVGSPAPDEVDHLGLPLGEFGRAASGAH